MPLVLALRRAHGDDRQLIDAPAQLFEPGEDDAGLSFLAVALLFLWDGWLVPEGADVLVFHSHDEYARAFARLGRSAPLYWPLIELGVSVSSIDGFEPLSTVGA